MSKFGRLAISLAVVGPMMVGCSIQKMASAKLADTLSESGSSFSSDDDPELVREAVPFALKTMEMLLEDQPDHVGLRLATGSGFTQYAFGFIQMEADYVEVDDFERALEMRDRALRMYLRALDHLLHGLDVLHPGISAELRSNPIAAAERIGLEEIDLAYWTALTWGGAVAAGKDRPELLADLGSVGALLRRLEALDADHDDGGLYEALMAFEAGAAMFGGSIEQAKRYFDLALEASDGKKVGTFVGYAESIAIPQQDREAYLDMLDRALAVDLDLAPEHRLANRLYQKRARWLRERVDDEFLPPLDDLPPLDEGE